MEEVPGAAARRSAPAATSTRLRVRRRRLPRDRHAGAVRSGRSGAGGPALARARRRPRDGAAANALLAALAGLDRPLLAIKQGLVGGPPDRPGCAEIAPELIVAALDGLDGIAWERDPDFGYEVPAAVPGVPEPDARVLVPRLLYADNDRVYEHAGLVADKQRERHAIAAAVPGLDPRVAAAAGWPPVPTGGEWGG